MSFSNATHPGHRLAQKNSTVVSHFSCADARATSEYDKRFSVGASMPYGSDDPELHHTSVAAQRARSPRVSNFFIRM